MMHIPPSSYSAMNAFADATQVYANNVANATTNSYVPTQTTFNSDNNRVYITTQKPTLSENDMNRQDFVKESANSIIYANGFEANTKTVQAVDDMVGTVIDMVG